MPDLKLTAKQQSWLEHIKAWRTCGLTKREYCAENNLNLEHMNFFFGVLRHKGALEVATKPKSVPKFVPLPMSPASNIVRFHLGGNRHLELPNDPILIVQVVRGLI